jgi:3-hydroxyisobutyrate dehydrogenase-like beta-hydroxyacid dehydrogenase
METTDNASIATTAVIGLGAMGSRMAERLLAGHDVVVWNRTEAKARPLVEAGARAATSPAAAAAQADVVITMVSDPTGLRNVTEGPAGVLSGLGPGSTLIEMSTVGPAAITRLASLLPPGAGLLDAPVLGSIAEAGAGALRIFVGGPLTSVDHCRPVLSRLGTPVHVGRLGSGAAAKLVANATAIESGDYSSRFALSLARKDADLVVDAARGAHVDLRLGAAGRTWLVDADDAGLGDLDYTAVLGHIIGLSDNHHR